MEFSKNIEYQVLKKKKDPYLEMDPAIQLVGACPKEKNHTNSKRYMYLGLLQLYSQQPKYGNNLSVQ